MANAYLPALVSAPLQVVLDKFASFMIREIGLIWDVEDELKKLERTFLRTQIFLDHAEEKQISHIAWKIWLRDLKATVYEADDLLDGIAVSLSQKKLDQTIQNERNQVRKLVLSSVDLALPHKIKAIREKLEDIGKEIEGSQLIKSLEPRTEERLETSSLVENSSVFGREDEKQNMINLLLANDPSADNFSVISVVGIAGLGKTTLAQVVYNDLKVCNHFHLRMWVSMSKDFNMKQITKSIIESITKRTIDLLDLNLLQITLEREIRKKLFLLVLDGMWNENCNLWDTLKAPLRVGASGSKILVTTQSQTVMSIVGSNVINLQVLSDVDCWSLFQGRAFENRNPVDHPNLVAIGKEIVKKCKGLPLAAKTLGSILKSITNEREWNTILRSEIWDLPEEKNDILPILFLSYKYLPAYLKQCFAYCSLFPKGYEFEKDKLVQLWMAEGFIQPKGTKEMEDVGSDYFDTLLQRSLFQNSHVDLNNKSRYVMHDLIHNLAQFVSASEYYRMDDIETNKFDISSNVRHTSLHGGKFSTLIFEALHKYEGLRTILLQCQHINYIHEVPFNLFTNLKYLRVLDFSSSHITELPSSIGNLIHLRYLDLSKTQIKVLPRAICSLHCLQTLKLKDCIKLLGLPKDMMNLTKLRHLDLDINLWITSMPPRIGNLTSLQTLGAFVAGIKSGCMIGEMKNMTNLRGTLCISKLENVGSEEEAKDAGLNNKQYLDKLVLRWNKIQDDTVGKKVLEGFQPHKNLKDLQIIYYCGASFPSWVGCTLFSNLTTVSLDNCINCMILPPLGNLPILKTLNLSQMDSLYNVDGGFYGEGTCRGFPSLETLVFSDMPNLVKWEGIEEGDFICLRQFTISKCPRLFALPLLQCLNSLQYVEISYCLEIQSLPKKAMPTSLKYLVIDNCPLLKRWYDTEEVQDKNVLAAIPTVVIDGIGVSPS